MAKICYIGKNLKTMGTLHSHSCWEFVYCVSGDGCMTTDKGGSYFYRKNQLLVIPPFTEHISTNRDNFENIHFIVEDWHPEGKIKMVVSDTSNNELLTLLEMCCRYFNTKFDGQETIIQQFSDLILQIIVLNCTYAKVSDTVQIINSRIVDNFNNPKFDLEDVFEEFDLSSDYLRRQHIKERGCSPLQCLTNTRIDFAKKMLTSQSAVKYKICDIALMSGFNDQLYFSRMFKKCTGLSPKDYASQVLRERVTKEDKAAIDNKN